MIYPVTGDLIYDHITNNSVALILETLFQLEVKTQQADVDGVLSALAATEKGHTGNHLCQFC